MGHEVFLSYSSKDKATAEAVCKALEANSVRVWIAPRDIPAGALWAEAIPKAIRSSRALVLIYSSGANSSVYIPRELNHAVSANILIIPFRLENVKPAGSLDFLVSASQWLDAFPPPLERHLDNLVRQTRQQLGMRATSEISIKPTARSPAARKGADSALMPVAVAALEAATPTQAKPSLSRSRAIAAAAGVVVLLALVGLGFANLSGDDMVAQTKSNRQSADADSGAGRIATNYLDPLPGMDAPGGDYVVLSARLLKVGGHLIELAGVGTPAPDSTQKITNWMQRVGATVSCLPAGGRGKYRCAIGSKGTPYDVASEIVARGWATAELKEGVAHK